MIYLHLTETAEVDTRKVIETIFQLHTWGRVPLVYHPHVHFVVPGGGVDPDRSAWCSSPTNFFLHHGTLIRVYKAKFADAMRDAELYDEVPDSAWNGKWVGKSNGAFAEWLIT